MDRRRFLLTTAATAVTLPALRGLAQTPAPTATLTLHSDASGATVPENFIGLSYETQQLSDPTFFSPGNEGLVAQFRALAPHGVLRIGGNTSDVGWWKPTPASKQPPLPPNVVIVPLRPEQRPFQELAYFLTPQAVVNLRAFLDATGWTCLYGINLGTSTPARAAEEAVFVARTLGPRLEYFQIGNEPDEFPSRFREKTKWSAEAYLDEWLAAAKAIRASVPSARFGLPDTAGNPQWSAVISTRLAAMHEHPEIAAISHHYYFTGPPTNPKANLDDLLTPDPKVPTVAETIRAAATKVGTKYRMTEGNSCYSGGRPGMSDVFGASLWSADYLLHLASLGYAGANLHGGTAKAIKDGLGGTLPGELLMPDPKVPHPQPFYTPIAEMDGHYIAEPTWYGLKFAGHFAGATFVRVDFNPGEVNATAFAAKLPSGQTIVAIINKDKTKKLHIDLPGFSLALTMSAPSLASTKVELTEPAKFREASIVAPATAVLLYGTRG